jgi:hypothetical protein
MTKPRTDPSSRTHNGFRPTHVKPSGVKARRRIKSIPAPERKPAIVEQWCQSLEVYRVDGFLSDEGLDKLTELRLAAEGMVKR